MSPNLLNDWLSPAERACETAQKDWKTEVGYIKGVKCCWSCRWCRGAPGDHFCAHRSIPHMTEMPSDLWVDSGDVCDLWKAWPDSDEDNYPVILGNS